MAEPLNVVCVGGGPAGLYFSILWRLNSGESQVTVLERNPAGVTYGWGLVFWEGLVDRLHRGDPESAGDIAEASVSWSGQVVCMGHGRYAHVGGSGYSIGRQRLLDILARRALALGVDVRYEREVEDLSEVAEADLVIACDGASSRLRQQHADRFGTCIELGRNKYIWLGTSRVFDAFTFAFERTPAGWIWFHAYRFDDEASTCIVECSPETWAGLGLDELDSDASLALLGEIFEPYLDGHALTNQQLGLDRAPWLNFKWVSNQTWRHGRLALMGDAAHTTHFAIGLGTELAILDAIALASSLRENRALDAAVTAYEGERRRALLEPESKARSSALWFEEVDRHGGQDVVQFAYSLWTRRGGFSWWRAHVHLALQTASGRALWRWFVRVRRALLGRRRALRALTLASRAAAAKSCNWRWCRSGGRS